MAQRKLIRPDLTTVREQLPAGMGRRRSTPQERTHAECYYYLKQMNQKTPMTVVLVDGEVLDGWIEWYDHDCLKVNREDSPNLVVMKHQIKYLYKTEETDPRRGRAASHGKVDEASSSSESSKGSSNGRKRSSRGRAGR